MSINRNLANFATSITSDGKAYITITVTVASVGGGNRYHFDGTSQQILSLSKGITYRFDTSSSSVSGHPLRFSTTSNGTHNSGSQFTTGITTVGSAGSAGSYVQVTLEQDAPDHLYSYCQYHANMGALVKNAPIGDPNFASFAGTFTFPTSDGSANQVLKTDGSGTLSFAAVAASYGNSDVDTHLNTSGASSGQILGWNGSDYAWVADSNTGIGELSDDTTPQLGGDLDVVTRSIVSTSNRNIAITPNGSGKVVLDGISHPNADGNSGQVLSTDGSGNLSFASVGSLAGSGIQNVSDDTSPQLGASLDVVTHSIVSTSNRNINITPDGSGKVVLDGLSYPQADGSADQVLKTDGSGNLSFVAQATGGGGGSLNATASGVLSNGQTIVVNSDGTVSPVYSEGVSVGSTVKYVSNRAAFDHSAVFDSSNNKVVVIYADQGNSNYGTAVVGTVSGETISFGTPVVFASHAMNWHAPTFDNNSNKVVIAYANASYHGYAIVGTVSSSSISFGSPVNFNSTATIGHTTSTFDSTNNKVLISFMDGANSLQGYSIVGSVSGTGISFGSKSRFAAHQASGNKSCFDTTSGKAIIFTRNSAASNPLIAVVATISGTSVSFGSPVTVFSSATTSFDADYDSSNNKTVVFYKDNSNGYGKAQVGTISGTSISFASAVTYKSASNDYIGATFDATANKFIVAFQDGGNSNRGTVIRGTVSGTTISFSGEEVFNSADSQAMDGGGGSSVIDVVGTSKAVVVFRDNDGSGDEASAVVASNAVVSQLLTSENFVGISDGAYANGATATIQTAGSTDDAQSGLTAGQSYYVQADGTLGLSPDTISVLAGTAVSATELLINPDTNPAIFGTTQVDAHLNISSASSGQILSWNGSDYAWTADSIGLDVVNSHSQTLSSNTTVAATDNAMSVGPLTVANGITLTISSGARYVVV